MSRTLLNNSNLMKKLNRGVKGFYGKNRKKIKDIILYGSAVRGKTVPRDIDIMIVFRKVDKKEYFELPYELRKNIEKTGVKADVKGIETEEIFSPNLLARQNLLIEGYSLITNKPLREILGFEGYSLFAYSIKNLSHNEKTKFQYALKGRRNKKGIIEELKGNHINAGVVLIPIENSEMFKEFLEKWSAEYKTWKGIFVKG